MKPHSFLLAVALSLGAISTIHAQATQETSATLSTAMSEGEIRKVDRETGKLTVRHSPLINLNMPGMTMVFTAKEPSMLEGLEQGSHIRFVAERIDGVYTIVRLQKQGEGS